MKKTILAFLLISTTLFATNENQNISENIQNSENVLLKTSWNQKTIYNKFFPKVKNQNTAVGCVQVAMGQVMKYHNHPAKGKGVIVNDLKIYDYNGTKVRTDKLTANLKRDYNWSKMSKDDKIGEGAENDEVAHLMKDLLVVTNASKVGIRTTSSRENMEALIENYGYSNTIEKMVVDEDNRAEFIEIIKSQIDLEQPVLFSVRGHMTVADGYKTDENGTYVHLNFGWGGKGDGFYNIDEDISPQKGRSYDHKKLEIVYNIKPCSEEAGDCYVNLEEGDSRDGFDISGVLENATDSDKYEIFLEGQTTIPQPQGYFIELYDSKHNLIQSEHKEEIVRNLPADKYTLKISLRSNSGKYFPTTKDYALTIR